jgi:hypothetical protein
MKQTIKTGLMGAVLALAGGMMACSPATADAGHHKSDALAAPSGAATVHPISGLKVIPWRSPPRPAATNSAWKWP